MISRTIVQKLKFALKINELSVALNELTVKLELKL